MTPDSPETKQRLRAAQQLLQSGHMAEAETFLREMLAGEPANATALHMLGLALAQTGRRAEGAAFIERSIAARPGNVSFRQNYAALLAYSDQPGETRKAMDVAFEALEISPDNEALRQLLHEAGVRIGMTPTLLNDWMLASAPPPKADAAAWLARGGALDQIGDVARAAKAYKTALEIEPKNAAAARSLAYFLVRMRVELEHTVPALRRAIELAPTDPATDDLRVTLGLQLAESGNVADGEAMLRALIDDLARAAKPAHERTLAAICLMSGRAAEAIALFTRAAEQTPDDLVGQMQTLFSTLYMPRDDPAELLARHRALDARFGATVTPLPPRAVTSAGGRRLKIGYLSGDFYDSSVAKFFLPLIEAQAAAGRVEIHCFKTQAMSDGWTLRFQACADGWHPVHDVSDSALAARIRTLEIDVLIDLAGYTLGTRLMVFPLRAAPLQVTYLGYPSTTGLSGVDARITDVVCDPPGQSERFHSERLLRMPNAFAVFRAPDGAPPVAPSPALLEGRVTFGSASFAAKVNDGVIDAWAAALRAAPSSTRLLLINAAYADASTRERISRRFAALGIDAAHRVEFVGRMKFNEYLNAHARIDLMLDTFPFNGHTTTVQHLWMGVPVLTIAGVSHRARMGASVLSAIGLTQLIARDPKDFAARAAELARNPRRLADLRATLRARMMRSPLMNEADFARDFDALLLAEWERVVADTNTRAADVATG